MLNFILHVFTTANKLAASRGQCRAQIAILQNYEHEEVEKSCFQLF